MNNLLAPFPVLNAALRRLGYGREDMTTHGFRSMASTLLNELGWNTDAIELRDLRAVLRELGVIFR